MPVVFALMLTLVGALGGDLPKVETDYTTIRAGARLGKTLSELVPPGAVQRLVLTHDHGISTAAPAPKAQFDPDPDALFARLFKSSAKAQDWGRLASEGVHAEFILVTKAGELLRVELLRDDLMRQGALTAYLLYGKGYACRFAIPAAPAKRDGRRPPPENQAGVPALRRPRQVSLVVRLQEVYLFVKLASAR